MTTLESIDRVERNITKAPVKAVRILHCLIYGREGDRQNRKRLRQFDGFTFDADTDEYRNKLLTFQGFQENDLVTVCSILCLDYTGEKANLATRLINGLRDLKVIEEAAQQQEDEDNDDDGDESENEGNESVSSGLDNNNERLLPVPRTS